MHLVHVARKTCDFQFEQQGSKFPGFSLLHNLTVVNALIQSCKLIFCRTISFPCPEKSQREYLILFTPKNHESLYFLSCFVKLLPIENTTGKKLGNLLLKAIQLEDYVQCFFAFHSNTISIFPHLILWELYFYDL